MGQTSRNVEGHADELPYIVQRICIHPPIDIQLEIALSFETIIRYNPKVRGSPAEPAFEITGLVNHLLDSVVLNNVNAFVRIVQGHIQLLLATVETTLKAHVVNSVLGHDTVTHVHGFDDAVCGAFHQRGDVSLRIKACHRLESFLAEFLVIDACIITNNPYDLL